MILPSQVIEALSSDPLNGADLIAPFVPLNLRASSYDLTVGDEYYIGQDGAPSSLSTQHLKAGQSFTIPPHAVCFILSAETIHLPPDVTAKVSLRMTHIYAGMILSSQPPFDPNYKGRVVVMLNNLSSEPFHLKQGERVATIEFSRLESKSNKTKAHRPVGTLQEQLPKPLISSLTEIASQSADTRKKVYWLSGQIVIFVTLVVAVSALPSIYTSSAFTERLVIQGDHLKDMSQALEEYKKELEQSKRRIEELEKRTAPVIQNSPAGGGGLKQSSATEIGAPK